MRKTLDELLKTVPKGTKFEEIATGPAVGLEDAEGPVEQESSPSNDDPRS